MHKMFVLQEVYFMPLHVSSICAHHQEVKIALHSLWYHHTYRWPSRAQVERGLVNYEDKYTEMHGQQNVKIIRSVQVFFLRHIPYLFLCAGCPPTSSVLFDFIVPLSYLQYIPVPFHFLPFSSKSSLQ